MRDAPTLLGIVVAALGGLAVGVERQRSGHAIGERARFGGVRTFTLIGGCAGIAGWLASQGLTAIGTVVAAGTVALVVAGYVTASRRDIDATTEAAALVVIAAGIIAGVGWLAPASAIVAITTLLLVEKSELHALVARIDDQQLRAAARFGVMAVVVLPLLPEGPLPLGVRPRELWLLVLFFSGLSFCGFLARRVFGVREGYPLAGLLGGLISSTNVTYSFARLSRRDGELSRPLAIGTVAACTMLFPRVLLAASVLNLAVARALLPYLFAPFVVGVMMLAFWWKWRESPISDNPSAPPNPLQLGPALQMAGLFQVVLWLVAGVRQYVGESGLAITAAVLGLTDVDALTISMTRVVGSTPPSVAAEAIAVGILANTMMKLALAIVLGTPDFRRLTTAFVGAMGISLVIAIVGMR